jgi:hypothetical protein
MPGDMYLYRNVHGNLVAWLRDDNGAWHASDESQTHRGAATDDEVDLSDEGDWVLSRGGHLLGELFGLKARP